MASDPELLTALLGARAGGGGGGGGAKRPAGKGDLVSHVSYSGGNNLM